MPTTTPYPAPSGRTGAIVFVDMLSDNKAFKVNRFGY
jgi:hypothetical protein